MASFQSPLQIHEHLSAESLLLELLVNAPKQNRYRFHECMNEMRLQSTHAMARVASISEKKRKVLWSWRKKPDNLCSSVQGRQDPVTQGLDRHNQRHGCRGGLHPHH